MSEKILLTAEEAAEISSNNLTKEAIDEIKKVDNYIKSRAQKGYTSGSIEVSRILRDVVCKELRKAGYNFSYSDYSPNIDIKW